MQDILKAIDRGLSLLPSKMDSKEARDAVNALDPTTATLEDLITSLQLT